MTHNDEVNAALDAAEAVVAKAADYLFGLIAKARENYLGEDEKTEGNTEFSENVWAKETVDKGSPERNDNLPPVEVMVADLKRFFDDAGFLPNPWADPEKYADANPGAIYFRWCLLPKGYRTEEW